MTSGCISFHLAALRLAMMRITICSKKTEVNPQIRLTAKKYRTMIRVMTMHYPLARASRANLDALAAAVQTATGWSLKTIAPRVGLHSSFFDTPNKDFSVSTYDKTVERFAAMWPEGAKWPRGVERPR